MKVNSSPSYRAEDACCVLESEITSLLCGGACCDHWSREKRSCRSHSAALVGMALSMGAAGILLSAEKAMAADAPEFPSSTITSESSLPPTKASAPKSMLLAARQLASEVTPAPPWVKHQQGNAASELPPRYHRKPEAIAATPPIKISSLLSVGQILTIPFARKRVQRLRENGSVETQPVLVGEEAVPSQPFDAALPSAREAIGGAVAAGKRNSRWKTPLDFPNPLETPNQALAAQSSSSFSSNGIDQPTSQLPQKTPTLNPPNANSQNHLPQQRQPQQERVVATPMEVEVANQALERSAGQKVVPPLPPLPDAGDPLPESAPQSQGYIWPTKGKITSDYGRRWGRMHEGIDIAAPINTPIVAAASGKVVKAGWNSGGYGNWVKIKHSNGDLTIYAHNQKVLVRRGEKVDQGEQIAKMGSTGHSTGSHLHFEIHKKGKGAVNPVAYLPGSQPQIPYAQN